MTSMLDVVAGGLALYASACLYLRSDALKPVRGEYPDATLWVRLSLFGVSLIYAAYALPLFMGSRSATANEAVLIAPVALAAHVLWRNIRRQARGR